MKHMKKKRLGTVRRFFTVVWERKTPRLLLLLSGALLTAAVIAAICLFSQGVTAQNNAKTMAEAYNKAVFSQTPSAKTPLAQGSEPVATTQPEPTPITIEGYQVIGMLKISKISAELPVIATTDEKALEVSVCYYQGPMPNKAGNLVITGHNFSSGAHFGRLNELEEGDDVTMSTPDGNIYRYTVYEKQEIKPDNVAALDDVEGDHELTLMTYTSHGNRRLLARCAMQEND